MIKGYRDFIMRGNVVDLAVAVVMGAAFGAVVTSLVEDLLTPLIGVIAGEPDFRDLTFTLNGSEFQYGSFLNALFSFLMIGAGIYFFVVTPLNHLAERRKEGVDPDVKDCPECTNEIPFEAKRCPHCTAQLVPS
jgi:large conductance mechanosensitive channel